MGSYRSSSLKCAVGSKKSWTESWHRAPTRSAVRPSAGLFERRDKYSPPVPDRYFSSLSRRDFHGSQLNAHASANSDSIHGRFCRTVQSFGFISQRANSASTGSMGVLVSDSSTGSCLSSLVLFACFMALRLGLSLHYTLCNEGHRSPENAGTTLRQVFCGAARKESHLPFQLSGARQVDSPGWRTWWQRHCVCHFQSKKKKKKNLSCWVSELYAFACLTIETTVDFACWNAKENLCSLIVKLHWTIKPLFCHCWIIQAHLLDSQNCNSY